MAFPSNAEVESMIQTAIGVLDLRVGNVMVQLEKDQVSTAAAREALDVMQLNTARTKGKFKEHAHDHLSQDTTYVT